MNFKALDDKVKLYNDVKSKLSAEELKNWNQNFSIEFTHNSTAIEGNTLSLLETKLVLEEKIAPGNKTIREIDEIRNNNKAFEYVQSQVQSDKKLDEKSAKEIHRLVTENILPGGSYRNVNVIITGSAHRPPDHELVPRQMSNFFKESSERENLHPIEKAAWVHAEFVKIHPYPDGNGRTSRLMMNHELLSKGYPAVDIKVEDRLKYFETLETYSTKGDIKPFTKLVAEATERQVDRFLEHYNYRVKEVSNEKKSTPIVTKSLTDRMKERQAEKKRDNGRGR